MDRCFISGIHKSTTGKGSLAVVIDEAGKLSTVNVSAEALENLVKRVEDLEKELKKSKS